MSKFLMTISRKLVITAKFLTRDRITDLSSHSWKLLLHPIIIYVLIFVGKQTVHNRKTLNADYMIKI